MIRIILFVALGLVLWMLYLSVRAGFWLARSKDRKRRREQVGGEMVRDPVCGTYVPKDRAVSQSRDGEHHYYCSRECAEEHAAARSESD